MEYRIKPRKVHAAQWDPKKPGDVIGMLANHGIACERTDDDLFVDTPTGGDGLDPTDWVVIDGDEVDLYSDARFRARFEARITRGTTPLVG